MELGINFRASSGYVTDGTNETYCLGDEYPTTRGGATFGWDVDLSSETRDRDNGIDVRLAGINYKVNDGSQQELRLDLDSTGNYDIRLALGDASSSNVQYAQFKDNATVFATIDGGGTDTGEFFDAEATKFSSANWPGSNVAIQRSFGSTIFKVIIGTPTTESSASTIAHLYVESLAGGLSIPIAMHHYTKNIRSG